MRRVGGVEGVKPELNFRSLPHRELTEDGGVQIDGAGSTQGVKPGGSERDVVHRRERQRIEPGLARTGQARIVHIRQYLIGALRAARRVQGSVRSRHTKRIARIRDQNAVYLPAGKESSYYAAFIDPPFPFSERQLRQTKDAEIVGNIILQDRLVQVVVLRDVNCRPAVAEISAAKTEVLRPRVSQLERVA